MMPPTITERFPPLPLDQVTACVQAFTTANPVARRQTIEAFVDAHPIISYEWGGDWRYRRARSIEAGQVLSDVSELIWRTDVPARIGRANPTGRTVLYLADRHETALSEIRVAESDVVISEFSIRADRAVRLAPVGEMLTVQRTGRGYLAGHDASVLNDLLNACAPDDARSMLLVDAFLLSCLTNVEDDYELSSSVADAIYRKLPSVSVIAFPSRRQLGGICFAVREEAVWRDWGIVSVRSARARHLAMGVFELSDVRLVTGITNAGVLVWDDRLSQPDVVTILGPPWHPVDSSVV